MKRLIRVTTYILVFTFLLTLCSSKGVLSQAGLQSDKIARWSAWRLSDPYVMSLDTTTKFQGKSTIRFQSTAPLKRKNSFVGCYQEFKADEYKGKRLCLTGNIKTEGIKERCGLWMVVQDADEIGLALDNMSNRALEGTGSWKKCSLVLDVPKNAYSITIGFKLVGEGTAWISPLSLKEVPLSVKTTEIPVDETQFPVAGRIGEKPAFSFTNQKSNVMPWTLSGWNISASSDYDVSADEGTLFEGKASGHLKAKVEEPKKFATFYQDVLATEYKGKKLRFTGYVKTKDVSDWTGLWLRVDGGGNVLGFDNMEERPIKGTTDWKKYSVVLAVPENAHRFKFGFMQAGSGSSWLNNCSLETVGDDVPATGKPMEPTAIPRPEVLPKPVLEYKLL